MQIANYLHFFLPCQKPIKRQQYTINITVLTLLACKQPYIEVRLCIGTPPFHYDGTLVSVYNLCTSQYDTPKWGAWITMGILGKDISPLLWTLLTLSNSDIEISNRSRYGPWLTWGILISNHAPWCAFGHNIFLYQNLHGLIILPTLGHHIDQ